MMPTCSPMLRVTCGARAPGRAGTVAQGAADWASAASCLSLHAQQGSMAALGRGMHHLEGVRAVQDVEEGGHGPSLRKEGGPC
jgi:hypothetical protein